MRVFVAVDIPAGVRAAIGALVTRLDKTASGARWVRVEAMHVTLKFIGETEPSMVERIKSALGAVRSSAPVEMRFRGVGFFPSERHPRVFWAGIEASPNLSELAAGIEQRLEPLGIPRDDRAFRPHLTLARFKSEDGLPRLLETLAALGSVEFGAMTTAEMHLYQSQLRPGGAEYTRLGTFAFSKSVP